MTDAIRNTPALSRARLLTIVWIASAVLSVVLLPLGGVARETSMALRTTGVLGVAMLFCAQLLVMWSAVTPWASVRTHFRTQVIFVVAALMSVPLVAPVSPHEWATWAWMGASVIGTAPLVWRWPTVAATALICAIASVAIALVQDADWVTHLGVTLGIGAGLAALNWTPFWLWELLVRAEMTQQAGAHAAAAAERNRFGRDVHDVLGHDLTVIALKAELAARTASSDPVTSARESAEVRSLANASLARLRRSLVADRTVDLQTELAQMEGLLTAAGVECALEIQPVDLAPPAAQALSLLIKEATTNVLRHSHAQWCTLSLTQDQELVELAIVNDRPIVTSAASPGTGIGGARARLAAIGGEVTVERDDTAFRLRATVPVRHV